MSAVFEHEFTVTLPPSHYRAWHKSAKQMFFSRTNDMGFTNAGGDHHIHNLVSFDLGELSPERIVDYDVDGNPEFERELVYMRNTGLKDKNGTEIYEGDLLLTIYGEVALVEFSNGHWLSGGAFLGMVNEEQQVVGNIHENKELLK